MTNSPNASSVAILLDDCSSSDACPTSRLLTNPSQHLVAQTPGDIDPTLRAIQNAQRHGMAVVALLSYELGEHLQGMNARQPEAPLIEAFAFEGFEQLTAIAASEWINAELKQRSHENQPSGILNITSSITPAEYNANIMAIQECIAAGETYQVNHTFKLCGQLVGDPLALYARLRERQPVRYGAFIDAGSRQILSFSPELFLESKDGLITAKPMKGTRNANQGHAQELALNEKDRAENLMITDLIRNDLGRICDTGSVAVPKLFEVERIGSVYQMTSTVTGRLKSDLHFADLLAATFPCGSITGAPKRHTMGIIQALESQPRNLYCGSIACLEPDGSLKMNVAIRTLEIDRNGDIKMGIGSGITADSEASAEWDECMTKAAFVTSLPSPVGLIETMRAEAGKIALLSEHLDRLLRSAKALRIPCDLTSIKSEIASTVKVLSELPHMVRLELSPGGTTTIQTAPIAAIIGNQKVFWAVDLIGFENARMSSKDPLLAHKTTCRAAYDAGWKAAVEHGGFDAIFTNERGEVTEGGRSSIFLLMDGRWKTPALKCGVLPGVMRSKLLHDPQWQAKERVIYPGDVLRADRVILANALRGIIEIDRSGLGAPAL